MKAKQRLSSFIRVLIIVLVFLQVKSPVVPNQEQYNDIKKFMRSQCDLYNVYIEECLKVKAPRDYAAAIRKLHKGFRSLLPEIKAMIKKYPHLNEITAPPTELKPYVEIYDKYFNLAMEIDIRYKVYSKDPIVQKEQAKLREVYEQIGDILDNTGEEK